MSTCAPPGPNPSTSPRAAPRDLGRSRAISGDLGAAPRYLGRSRSVARAAAHLLKKGRARLEPRGSRARSVLAASLCATRAGEAAPRAARSSPSTPTPARTAHLGPPGVTLALVQGNPAGLPSPHLRRVRSVLRPWYDRSSYKRSLFSRIRDSLMHCLTGPEITETPPITVSDSCGIEPLRNGQAHRSH